MKISSKIASSRDRLLIAVKYWNHCWQRLGSVWYSTQCIPQQQSKPTGIYMSWNIHPIWTLFFCRKSTTLPVTIWWQINFLFLIFTELLLCNDELKATVSLTYSVTIQSSLVTGTKQLCAVLAHSPSLMLLTAQGQFSEYVCYKTSYLMLSLYYLEPLTSFMA